MSGNAEKYRGRFNMTGAVDIIIIGAGAAGLMAAVGCGEAAAGRADEASTGAGGGLRVVVLEKMPRPGRKIMITGKGRCNLTNVKDWEDFSQHIHPKANLLRPAFYSFPPQAVIGLMESCGVECVVERGDRAFPASHVAADVVDALVRAAKKSGAEILCNKTVTTITPLQTDDPSGSSMTDDPTGNTQPAKFEINCQDGSSYRCKKLIITTGGLSYPTTGSTGDGLGWATALGLETRPTFPSLTALVPKNYKTIGQEATDKTTNKTTDKATDKATDKTTDKAENTAYSPLRGHIDRSTPLSDTGKTLMGCSLKNVNLSIAIDGTPVQEEFGDLDFTDGGIEGPIGLKVSRRCVNAIINGSKVSATLDLKPAVEAVSLEMRIASLWKEISEGRPNNRRGNNLNTGNRNHGSQSYEARFKTLLRKLLPQEIIPAFLRCNPDVDHKRLAKTLKNWKFDIAGFVGYERSVITAGGVSASEITAKTLCSKKFPDLYFAGEILDLDGDTGGYNLQTAFSTGHLAGQSAASAL